MTPQAILKAHFAELAETHGVRVTARRQAGKFYFEVFGEYPAAAKFMRAAFPDSWLTSGGGFSQTYGLPLRDVDRIVAENDLDPEWLKWNGSAAAKIARGIREEQAFERLPILADALEEAGCDNQAILRHCRESKAHGEVCWVVELLAGSRRKG
jgi:hypothetical protein